MPISDHVTTLVAEVRSRIAAARDRGGHGQDVTLIAVTKTHGADAVMDAWRAGVTDVGENRVQEADLKRAQVDVPVRWHLIGHLQRNKAKQAATFDVVHSLDSDRLALALNDAAGEANRVLDVLVQVNVSGESTKSGFSLSELPAMSDRLHACGHLRVRGIMTMAPFDAPETVLRSVFQQARDGRTLLREAGFPADWLSMGMSGDFEVAIEEGATHVRLGTMLFGSRT